jgi:hypothetical protein
MEQQSGRRWVRFTLALTLALSMAANVGHTVLADSTIPTWLRMIGAVFWPVLVFLAVEILVRVFWLPKASHRLARTLILVPGVPAAITSYEHMHAVLLAMGERPFIAAIGPGAVDVMMIGCTLTLLFTRVSVSTVSSEQQPPAMSDEQMEHVLSKWVSEERSEQNAPVSPAPLVRHLDVSTPSDVSDVPVVATIGERAPRAAANGTEYRLRELLGMPELKAQDSTMRRYAKIARVLRNDPDAVVDYAAEKVKRELVDNTIRPWARQERVR